MSKQLLAHFHSMLILPRISYGTCLSQATVRPSLAFYNNRADVDALVAALLRLTRRKPISSLP